MSLPPALLNAALALPGGRRHVIALAGPPASGKSTMAELLATALRAAGMTAAVVPMDGFHLDNATLDKLGLRHIKGAPETFDMAGFCELVARLHQGGSLLFPLFDRAADATVPDAGFLSESCNLVIVEGNYLLLDEPGWRDLGPLFDLRVLLAPPEAALERRLIQRWQTYGLPKDKARARAEGNDLPNARRVLAGSRGWDIRID